MNLKEAFRFQNKLQSFEEKIRGFLIREGNITNVTVTLLKSKVDPSLKDEESIESSDSPYSSKVDTMVAFYIWLFTEQEKLAKAIRRSKAELKVDMDSEISLNKHRQQIATILHFMIDLKSSERLTPGAGKASRFNNDGNPVTYSCDIKRVTKINYDRKKVRAKCNELEQKADQMSAEIDRCMINSNVDYQPPFDVNSSFDEVFENVFEPTCNRDILEGSNA